MSEAEAELIHPRRGTAVTVLALLFASAALPSRTLEAAPISYVFEGVGTGTAGGRAFTDAPFTIRAEADTSQVQQMVLDNRRIYSVPVTWARVEIAGLGEGEALTPTRIFSNWDTDPPAVGLSRMPLFEGTDLLDVYDTALRGYDLRGPFEPFVEQDPTFSSAIIDVTSPLGPLSFTNVERVTFHAVVPEPAVAPLLLIAAAGFLRRRRTSVVSLVEV